MSSERYYPTYFKKYGINVFYYLTRKSLSSLAVVAKLAGSGSDDPRALNYSFTEVKILGTRQNVAVWMIVYMP